MLVVAYLGFKSPRNHANWQTQFKVLSSVELEGDSITIKSVRDFRYNNDETIRKVRYLKQRYQLSEFNHAWFGLSHFRKNGLADVFMSFEFSGDKFLVVSIEARLKDIHVDGYNPIKGLFREYTKTIVLATVQTVIGLRTHIRKEPLNLYKLNVSKIYTKPLLLTFLREAEVLNLKPTFYNALVDNCMTGLLSQSDQFKQLSSSLDMRIILPEHSDQLAYEFDYIDTSKPFSDVCEQALVDANKTSIDDVDFLLIIRMLPRSWVYS